MKYNEGSDELILIEIAYKKALEDSSKLMGIVGESEDIIFMKYKDTEAAKEDSTEAY